MAVLGAHGAPARERPGAIGPPGATEPGSGAEPRSARLRGAFPLTDTESTLDLLERARAGDRQAMDRLFARYLPILRRWATGRIPPGKRDLADTHDLVQETLIQTFKKIETFEYRGEGALLAYLHQVLVNRIREEYRKTSRRPDRTSIDESHVDRSPSPLEEAIGQQALETYERAMERLRPEEREAIVNRVEMGLSYEQLAVALGKPTADAARKAAQRALMRLAEEMDRG
jgi:RNA polymerase sigma-70 factor (ECF subfamily)